LTDFGVSGEIANTAAFARTFAGTIKYMSPSRIKGNPHSAKSDIWSLGLVVLECGLGRYPYGDSFTTFFDFLTTLVSVPVPKPPEDTFSNEFCNFINLCLQKEEEHLPASSTLLAHPWIQRHKRVTLKDWITSCNSPRTCFDAAVSSSRVGTL